MKRKGQIIIGLALILIFILMALAAPVLAPNDPNATNLALKNAPPSAEYPLGCDQMGRCESLAAPARERPLSAKQLWDCWGTLTALMAKSCSKEKICSTCRNESDRPSMGKKSA